MSALKPESLELIERVFESLDYAKLGGIYCHEDGESFWAERREGVLRAGIEWANALRSRLGEGRSLYVGAGVAELPVLVMETVELGRDVSIQSLGAEECETLNHSLAGLGLSQRIDFQFGDASEVADERGYDHLSLVSVLNDPEHYPTVSDLSYGRLHPVLLDVAAFEAERSRLRALVDHLLSTLRVPAWVTTTVEEVPWLMAAAEARGLSIEADEEVIESAMVGDPLGFLRLRQA